jgi:hypothetical protein
LGGEVLVPGGFGFEHGVEDDEEVSHTGGEGDFVFFPDCLSLR